MAAGQDASVGAGDRSRAFRERARLEAGRYGPDPWIFVRELLQNSRDAGARRVAFVVQEQDGEEIVTCRDDGEGMTFEHARRYLFSLYASSKEDAKNQAGKFGVGFWSVLRFEPDSIAIRSRTATGGGWGLRLDGSLEHASELPPLETPGTEISLRRAGGDGRLEHRVFDAVWQSARYLHRRDDPRLPLPVTINGRPANAEFSLPAPSASFRRGAVRGVVGLGPAPRVELFCRGLRVRSAASLEDLVAPTGRHTARMRVRFPELPGGLAPQALLESDELELMLSRSDARDNRALARVVKLAQQELERLIERQLSHARPVPWHRRAASRMGTWLRESLLLRTALGCALGLALALGIAWWRFGDRRGHENADAAPSASTPVLTETAAAVTTPARPYRDLGARYRGPKVDVLSPGAAEPILLRYDPSDLRLHFAALSFPSLAPDGSPVHQAVASRLVRYPAATCNDAEEDCLEVGLPFEAAAGIARIPIPTGYRIVKDSVRLDDTPLPLGASAEGHPAVLLQRAAEGMLTYTAVRAPDPGPVPRLRPPPALSEDIRALAQRHKREPIQVRVERLLAEVRHRVRYDRSRSIATAHADAVARGEGFIHRTLAIGAGDCDVQNGLLVAFLQAAGVQSRLAVGYLGREGGVHPWLHAWVEYRDERGQWRVADASESAAIATPPLAVASGEAMSPEQASAAPRESIAPVAGTEPPPTLAPLSDPAPAVAPVVPVLPSTPTRHLLAATAPWAMRLLSALLLLAALWLLLGGRTRRATKLDASSDLSRLLQGVLQQPGAFGTSSALFTRPLVPLTDGGAISLNRARELATLGRLYRTARRPRLAERAMRAGAAVLDVRLPEGETVADAFGAVDLDRWAAWIDGSQSDGLCQRVTHAAHKRGEDWGLRIGSDDIPGGVAVLDLGPLGVALPGLKATRLVLVSREVAWIQYALLVDRNHPEVAAFLVLDRLAERLDLPADRRARLLSAGARKAILEAFSR